MAIPGLSCASEELPATADDCDDADPWVNPGASEVCDFVDTDCDPATAEAGLASFQEDAGGPPVDITAAISGGTPQSPTQYTVLVPGTLRFCEGTWFTQIALNADTRIHGAGSGLTTLDGGGTATIVQAFGGTHEARGLSFQHGYAEFEGGAMLLSSVDLDIAECAFEVNQAGNGGAISMASSSVTATDTVFRSNVATDTDFGRGGAIWMWDDEGGPPQLVLDTVLFDTNTALLGGGIMIQEGSVTGTNVTFVGNGTWDVGLGFQSPVPGVDLGTAATMACTDVGCP